MAAKPGMLICPYDKSHEIEPERMQFHLVKCEKNFDKEKVACTYNNLHRVLKAELKHHHEHCPDKKKVDTFMNEIGDTSCPVKDMVPINEGSVPFGGEDWDSEPPCPSALDTIQKKIEEKPVLRALKVSSKAKKKTFHQQERQRITELTDSTQRMTLTPAPQSMLKGVQSTQPVSEAAASSSSLSASSGKKQKQTKQPPAGISGAASASTSKTSSNVQTLGGGTLPAPAQGDGFCQLPIPGRGRGRSRNVE